MIEFFKTCMCCFAYIALKIHQASECVVATVKIADRAGCCLPCHAVIAVKDCYDHCDTKVNVENNDVEVIGAAPTNIEMT